MIKNNFMGKANKKKVKTTVPPLDIYFDSEWEGDDFISLQDFQNEIL